MKKTGTKKTATKAAAKKAPAKKTAAKKAEVQQKATPAKRSSGRKAAKRTTTVKKSVSRKTVAAPEARDGAGRERPSARSDDYRRLGRQVAAIALIRTGQGGRLNVRQKEELRRALLEAGEALLWDEMAVKGKNPLDAIADDLGKLTKSGIRVIEREVEADLKDKKSEMKRLVKVVEGARKLAEAKDDAFPTDISYSHTARAAAQGLVTKIETVEVTTQDEATSCADSIEKSMNRWEGLKDQMIDELQKKQALLTKLRGELPDFVKAQRTMLREVVAILH